MSIVEHETIERCSIRDNESSMAESKRWFLDWDPMFDEEQ